MYFSRVFSILFLINFSKVNSIPLENTNTGPYSNEDENPDRFSLQDFERYWVEYTNDMEKDFFNLISLENWEFIETDENEDDIYKIELNGKVYYRIRGFYDANYDVAYNASFESVFGDTQDEYCVLSLPEISMDICHYNLDDGENDILLAHKYTSYTNGPVYTFKSVDNSPDLPLKKLGFTPPSDKNRIKFGLSGRDFRAKEDDPDKTLFDYVTNFEYDLNDEALILVIKKEVEDTRTIISESKQENNDF